MIIKEYRIPMPMTVDEYHIGQLYSFADASLNETGGGDGIEIVRNESFTNVSLLGGRYTSGQYTMKKYHLANKVPKFLRLCLPASAMEVVEESWNAHPYSKTIVTNPKFLRDNFRITIETIHVANDRGTSENAHELSHEKLSQREVVIIDIARDQIPNSDYDRTEDPRLFRSITTGRGPLSDNWLATFPDPVMTAYKLVTVEFKYFGLQHRVEKLIQRSEQRLFTRFHRQIFCWIDKWNGLNLEQVHEIEKRIKTDLDNARRQGPVRGMMMHND